LTHIAYQRRAVAYELAARFVFYCTIVADAAPITWLAQSGESHDHAVSTILFITGGHMRRPFLLAATLLLFATTAGAQVTVTPQNASGIYKAGDMVQWTLTQPSSTATQYTYSLRKNGLTSIKQGPLEFVAGKAILEATLAEPGAVFLDIREVSGATAPASGAGRGPGGRGPNAGRIMDGALVDPENLRPTLPRPDDFDDWWAKKLEQLATIPPNPQLEKADAGRSNVEYNKITLNTIEGHKIQGQIARPAAEGKYPALLVLQWAGIYALGKGTVTGRAAEGWLAMNIEPHDIKFDGDAAYYQQLNASDLRDYYHQGNDDREKSYFLRMYLSAYRAVEYLASRPDWDGKTIVLTGTSMGGQQSIVTAGLNSKVTAVIVLVPSSCDATGPTIGRAAGFPDWAAQAQQKKDTKILETSRYFDPVIFASRIKCPALVSMGLYDETSPPVGVYSTFNQIQSTQKEVLPLHSGHQDSGGSQRPYNMRADQWLAALVKGAAVPPK
jgi:cephalosporin-C deacetylase-like acetyl esterase